MSDYLQQRRDEVEADVRAMLAPLTNEQLLDGVRKGRAQIEMLDAMEQQEGDDLFRYDIGHPGRHPSKAYETWSHNDFDRRRRALGSAIRDTLAELARRGVSA